MIAVAEEFSKDADALVASDLSEAHQDVRSLAATYQARRDAGDGKAVLFARALVKRARLAGIEAPASSGPSSSSVSVADLKAEIAARNEGREEDDLIRPESGRKADLQAALDADDAAQE